ncbi:hypothetical protein F511_34053 [Dorcoceras hygrometricum]|uniref:ABC1 atypical kinase-like domain-containing protein n=1 Tax=Dorcoceras hygrometricum TaxID=472368 RepID=A0A2Z7ASC7_9LAMI|nr:hypothetical protein F511_34053 [Dorcoceras hygrometricum]
MLNSETCHFWVAGRKADSTPVLEMRKHGAFRFCVKTSAYVIPAAGVASLIYRWSDTPSHPSTRSLDFPFNFLNGVFRSSRAFFTIASCVVDYKRSLYGVSASSDEYQRVLSEIHQRSATKILKLCDDNRGFYVKAGQFVAAMRQVPKEYSSTLSVLQDQAVPCNFDAIRDVIIQSLGKDLSEIFFSFDEQPVAAASIAQVHHAVLKDLQEVAVKVQYPGLQYLMKFDLATMGFLSKSVAWLYPDYRFHWMVSEFSKNIAFELDFIQEAKNSERAANNFKNNSMVEIPCIYWDYTSSQVLTMQFCTGQKVDDLEFLKQTGINPLEVAKVLVEAFAEMIFVHGFLHGDPHPGNILVSPRGPNGFSLVILDHGIYKSLAEEFRQNYCKLWEALILMDSQAILQLGEAFGVGKFSKYFPVIFTGRTIDSKSTLGSQMPREEREHLKEELKSLKMEDISSFMESLPPQFLAIMRTDGLLRSLVSKLGAPQRIRLLAYAKYSIRGASKDASFVSGPAVFLVYKFKTTLKYIYLRLLLEIIELAAYMGNIRHTLAVRLRRFISSLGGLVHSPLFTTPLMVAPQKKCRGC